MAKDIKFSSDARAAMVRGVGKGFWFTTYH